MPRLVRPPRVELRSRVFDSARRAGWKARPDDIVIATYSKCGTTWTQRIVSMLVFATDEPRPIWDVSPRPDARFGGPIGELGEPATIRSSATPIPRSRPLIPLALALWGGGPSRFLNKATNGRWRDVVAADDLARYDARGARKLSPSLACWAEHGRGVAGDPRLLPD